MSVGLLVCRERGNGFLGFLECLSGLLHSLPLAYDAEALSVFCSCGVLKFLGPAGPWGSHPLLFVVG